MVWVCFSHLCFLFIFYDFILDNKAIPAPLNYRGFTKSICTSVNHVICHGIPGDRILDEGDIVNIDVNEESNTITVTVSNKEVYDKLSELNNTTVNLNSVIEDDMYNYENNTEQN